jgi:hypothetical protein
LGERKAEVLVEAYRPDKGATAQTSHRRLLRSVSFATGLANSLDKDYPCVIRTKAAIQRGFARHAGT